MKLCRLCAFIIVMSGLSCAIPESPPGGPEDKLAPRVAATAPRDSAASVPAGSDIRITFSEKMTRDRLERQITFHPNVIIQKVKWDDKTIIFVPEKTLHPDTTYIVHVKAGFQDNHRVANTEGHQFAFATSARIDSGQISGTVYFRRKPAENGYVHLFVLPKDSNFVPEVSKADRESAADKTGRYVFRFLPTDGVRFLLWGFNDQSGNDKFESSKEVGELFADTLRLTADVPLVAGKDIVIVDPNEPGEVAGIINNLTGIDSFLVSVALFAANDTTPPAYYVRCSGDGAFCFTAVKAGSYALRAFLDVAADSLCGNYPCPQDTLANCAEPCVQYADSIRVSPGIKLKLDDLALGKNNE
ncbi:MAG: Ig-like domain-containing protein [Candidatus Latescibacterota bacterium]